MILKCYPRTTKGAVDVKPNSSELSYLLYYATTRRSKVQKVGAFLEKKTASDVWRARIGYVKLGDTDSKGFILKAWFKLKNRFFAYWMERNLIPMTILLFVLEWKWPGIF